MVLATLCFIPDSVFVISDELFSVPAEPIRLLDRSLAHGTGVGYIFGGFCQMAPEFRGPDVPSDHTHAPKSL